MKIYRDANNVIINIGEWDDKDGLNLLPEGSTEHNAEIVTGYDGGLYLADDPRRLQPTYQTPQNPA